jgi:glycosyltransferase involved in cell wall biosynthesis
MSRVFILTPALVHGDASSHFVLQIADALKSLGHQSRILAANLDPQMRRFGEASKRLPSDVGSDGRILLVHSTTSPWIDALQPPPAPTVLLYQGLTPPELCGPMAAHLMGPLRQARHELAALAPHLRGAICTSHFVQRELKEITGVDLPGGLLPLALEKAFEDAPPSIGEGAKEAPRLLVVGRVTPHKRLEDAFAIHGCVQRTFNPDTKLDVVGDYTCCPDYTRWLETQPTHIACPPPHWWGKVSFSELLARYRAADVLLFTSTHEGFGVPLLEAMTLGVPVVAVHCEGVAETLGSAGIVARERHVPALAELVEMVLTDSALRARLIAAGRERAREFSRENLKARFEEVWKTLAA